LGAFIALVCAGSASGIVAWSFNIRSYPPYFAYISLQATKGSRAELYRTNAAATLYYGSFFTPYAIEVLCLSLAKLLIIGRLVKHVHVCVPMALTAGGQRQYRTTLRRIDRVYAFCVTMCVVSGAACISGSVGATVLYLKYSAMSRSAADATNVTTGADTDASSEINALVNEGFTTAANWLTAQIVSEVVMLFSVILGYITVGPASALVLRNIMAVIDNALRHAPASAKRDVLNRMMLAAASQRRQLLVCYALVLATFVPRAAFNVLNVIANVNVAYNSDCGACDECQTLGSIVSSFLNATPEFQAIVVAISSPLPLTVSILFMINPTERRLLRGAAGAPPQLAAEHGAELLNRKMNIELPPEDLEQSA